MLRLSLLLVAGVAAATALDAATPEARAAALVRQMSLEEKVGQMQDSAPAIPRLGIPAYGWWNEALHGVARNGLATVFPQAIGRAATWDTDLEFRIADAISTEARAKFNATGDKANHQRYGGLTFWSPNINIFRDPRWGRGQETFGEDPFLTAQIAREFIRGMQGPDPNYFKTIATSKHFAVHSGPETGRHEFNARVSEADLENTYLPAFRATLSDAGAYSVMCAYNSLDGSPACANTDLLQTRLRGNWGFPGYVVSDCGAIGDIYSGHHFVGSMAEAAAKAVKAGTDLDCGTEYQQLTAAVKQGLIKEAEIDRSVTRLLEARIKLGLFDSNDRYEDIGADQIASKAHAELALEAAEKSMVLLKNDGLLPWTTAPEKLAVMGPAADDPDTLLGNYYGTPPHIVTPLAGIKQQFAKNTQVIAALGSVYAEGMTALVPPTNLPGGLAGRYFASPEASGSPALNRTDAWLYFHWGMQEAAIHKALPSAPLSVFWTGSLRPSFAGEYQLGLGHQECDSCPGKVVSRLFLEGKLLVDETRKAAGGAGAKTVPVSLETGKDYAIRAEYRQEQGGSGIELVWTPPARPLLEQAVKTAQAADAVVLCLGLNSRLEGEEQRVKIPGFQGGDRTSLDLPAGQQKLLDAVLATGKPVAVVLLNGSALSVNRAAEKANAILEAWYPGQEGGVAIARTLSGDNNPAGRLPVTFYRSVEQLPPFADYSMKGRTYRYFDGKPVFAFASGLSYSKFRYEKPAPGKGEISSRVTNISKRDGDEVVQLYEGIAGGHWKLAGFKRIHLRAGESKVVSFPEVENSRWEIAGKLPATAKVSPR